MSTALKNIAALKEHNLTFERIFEIMFHDEMRTACEFTENGEIIKWTYKAYKTKIFKAARKISKILGSHSTGCYVALKMANSPLWPVMFWAILIAGYKPVLIDPTLNDELTGYLMGQAGAKEIFTSPVDFEDEEEIKLLLWEDEVALCTSGTTSTSKIFTYSGEVMCYQIFDIERLCVHRYAVPDQGDKVLAFLPFNHVFGFIVQYLIYSFIGASVVYSKDRAPASLMNACRSHGVTHIMTVPLLLNNLTSGIIKKVRQSSKYHQKLFSVMINTSIGIQKVNVHIGHKLSQKLFRKVLSNLLGPQVKIFICGGSYTPYETVRIMNGIGYYVTCGYGMTELGIASVEYAYSLNKRLKGSAGQKFRHLEYKLADINNENEGELLVKGMAIHTGMLVDGRKVKPDVDSEGWFRTGDIGEIKKDTIWIKGRVKDIIINESGENIYPDELEKYFSDLPYVNTLSVLGTKKDKVYEYITLVLNMDPQVMTDENLKNIAEVINRINETLSLMKKINRVYVTSSQLPMVNGIKVKRNRLKELIESNINEFLELDLMNKAVNLKAEEKIKDQMNVEFENEYGKTKLHIRRCFSEVLDIPVENIRDDSHFINDLGGDSLSSIGLRVKIEELFNVVIPDDDYYGCSNVQDIALLILRKTKGLMTEPESAASRDFLPDAKIISRFEDSREYMSFLPRQQSISEDENPYFICHDSVLRDVSMLDGKVEVLNFGSYNYVGMSGHPETVQAAKEAIEKYGTSASGSRLLAGEKHLYRELEKEIAHWKHTEDALVLVGGHSTNVTFVGNFCNDRDLILYDALAHNSIIQGCQLSKSNFKAFPHNDYLTLESILRNARNKYEKILVVIEGAYSMDGDIAPLPEIIKLKKKYGFFLMVDEAHSACVIGENGGGVDEYFHLEPDDIDIKMGTLSKGLGTCGGYLAGKRVLIEYLRYNVPGFVFSVGISPPLAAATLQALKILQRDNSAVKRLHKNIDTFVTEAHHKNLNTCLAGETAIIPILVGKDEDAFILSTLLLKRGVFVPPAVYPAVPKGQARLRFCVTSEHKETQIKDALDILISVSEENGINIQNKFFKQ